jgi:hypothetical protein
MNLAVDDIVDIYFERTVAERVAALRLLESENGGISTPRSAVSMKMRRALERGTRPTLLGGIWSFTRLTLAARSKRLSRLFETLITETLYRYLGGVELLVDVGVIEEQATILEALRTRDGRRTLYDERSA